MEWAALKAGGSWYGTVLQTLEMVHSAECMSLLRISPAMSRAVSEDEAWAQAEQQLLEEAWEVLVQLAGARTVNRSNIGDW